MKMLTEQEIMNNALKELLFQEESLAKKYERLVNQNIEPNIQQMLKNMEQSTRNNYSSILNIMNKYGIS